MLAEVASPSDHGGLAIKIRFLVDESGLPLAPECESQFLPGVSSLDAQLRARWAILAAERGALSADLWQFVKSAAASHTTEVWLWGHDRKELEKLCAGTTGCHIITTTDMAPAVICKASPSALVALAHDSRVTAIDPYTPEDTVTYQQDGMAPAAIPFNSSRDFLIAMKFDILHRDDHGVTPLRGQGVTIAVVEGDRPVNSDLQFLPTFSNQRGVFCQGGTTRGSDHAASVMSVISSRVLDLNGRVLSGWYPGSAPEARLLLLNDWPPATCDRSGSANATNAKMQGVNWALARGASVINYSQADGLPVCAGPLSYGGFHRFLDMTVNISKPVVVAITGNNGVCTGVGNSSVNVISVGGSDPKGTFQRSDDVIWDVQMNVGSRTGNPRHGAELPHVVAPAIGIGVINNGRRAVTGGTSFAAPQVSGLAACIIQGVPLLREQPEGVKAVILATASKDVDGPELDLLDAVDDFDGAGEIDAGLAGFVASKGVVNSWNVATQAGVNAGQVFADRISLIGGSFAASGLFSQVVTIVPSGTTIQAALTWNMATTGAGANIGPVPLASYNLFLVEELRPGATILRKASLGRPETNYRFLRFRAARPGARYRLLLQRTFFLAEHRYGLSWVSFAG